MISYQSVRDGNPRATINEERTVVKALDSLVIGELAYGGVIQELTPTKLVIQTNFLGVIDTVTFEGSEEDMSLLVEAAALSVLIASNVEPDAVCGVVDQLRSMQPSSPLVAGGVIDVLVGEVLASNILYNLATDDEETAALLHRQGGGEERLDNLIAAIVLVREAGVETGQKFNDELLLELLGLEAPASA